VRGGFGEAREETVGEAAVALELELLEVALGTLGVPSRSRSAISTPPPLIVTRKRRSGDSPSASTTSSTAPSRSGGGSSKPGARRKIAPTLTSSPGLGAVHVQS
jgi:hypothetical protein